MNHCNAENTVMTYWELLPSPLFHPAASSQDQVSHYSHLDPVSIILELTRFKRSGRIFLTPPISPGWTLSTRSHSLERGQSYGFRALGHIKQWTHTHLNHFNYKQKLDICKSKLQSLCCCNSSSFRYFGSQPKRGARKWVHSQAPPHHLALAISSMFTKKYPSP